MGSNEEKKIIDEKKYAQLTRESVRLYAEAASHCDLPENVIATIAEDLNYRLREVVHNTAQFVRHSTQRKLTVEDFNKALRWSDIEPIYGHGNPEPVQNIYIKEAEIFCLEDSEINLVDLTCAGKEYDLPPPLCLRAEWLAVEGNLRTGPGTSTSGLASDSSQGPKFGHAVSAELMCYYDQITKAILGSDEKLLKLALSDLSSNLKISPLLPFLANFVFVGVKKMSHDLAQLSKLLHAIRSLVNNPSLYIELEPCLNLLVQSVLYCIVEPLAASINPINDHWVLRDSAANLLVKIVHEWSTPVNNLSKYTLEALVCIFNDSSKPFCSHYGAVIAIVAFGIQALEDVLYPHIANYMPHLMGALEGCSYSNAQIKTDAQKVHGLLLVVCDILIRSRLKTEFEAPLMCDDIDNPMTSVALDKVSEPKEVKCEYSSSVGETKGIIEKSSFDMYQEFYGYFGDALAARLPYIEAENVYIPKESPPVDLFFYPELLRSGDELLEIFYERDDDVKSNSIEDDNSYDDRDDISLLSDEHETDPVDLQVKSTVSDPTLGIKLTIAKMRRIKPPEEPKPSKKRKIMPKEPWEIEPLFDYVPLVNHSNFIEFNFEGATPVPRGSLKSRTFSIMNHVNSDSCLLSSEINSKLKKTGKKRTVDPKVVYRNKFLSGNLLNIL